MKEEYRILSATAILGYGFPESSFEEGMKRNPHLIAVDAGSTDPGPYYLGAGISFTDREAVKRDLEIMLKAGIPQKIPIVIGTAGGSGGDPHLEWNREIIEEVARENNLHFKLALISAQFDKEYLAEQLKAGKIVSLDSSPELSEEDILASSNIVGQMGMEPIIQALKAGADVVLAGRAYDPAVFAAPAVMQGYDKGLAVHLGKILECASICASPGSGSDCMFGYIGEDYFRVEPLNPIRKCTILSVAAHTLYEKSDPYILPGPDGSLDLTGCNFLQETPNIVRVTGSKYIPAKNFTVKLEGAKQIGYSTVSISGTRDPVMISKIDEIVKGVRSRVEDNFSKQNLKYYLNFNIYGKNGVMGPLEPVPPEALGSHELGIVIEAVADTQKEANTICSFARSTILHYGYEGRRATAGNMAFPYSPSDFQIGEVYVFSVYHLLSADDTISPFPIEMEEL